MPHLISEQTVFGLSFCQLHLGSTDFKTHTVLALPQIITNLHYLLLCACENFLID